MEYEVPYKKILIGDRGEIAVRIIRACRETGIVDIAVYDDADHEASSVHLGDEAYHIGGSPPSKGYLNIPRGCPAGKIGVMVPDEELPHFSDENVVALGLGPFTSMEAVAKKLFETMRDLDKSGVNHILTLAPSKEGIGLAVFDRLFKAAGSQLIEVD